MLQSFGKILEYSSYFGLTGPQAYTKTFSFNGIM